jgi:hypothetical protein
MAVFDGVIPAIAGAAAAGAGFQIDRSLRFNSVDSAYLSRTPSSAGNRKTWTWSGWVKRSELGGTGSVIFSAYNGASNQDLYITFINASVSSGPTDGIALFSPPAGANISVASDAVFRDGSAWYHIVCSVDTTQSTAADRVKIYVNGTEVTYNVTTYPSLNQELRINDTQPHAIGSRPNGVSAFFNGYLADVYLIDGQALAPTDFGEYDDNNVWQPKQFTGSYTQSSGGTAISSASGAKPILNTSDDDGQTVSSGVRTDSNASSIVLALPLNGSNGGTTITDYHHTIKGSGSAKAVSIYTGSASGGAVTSTAVSRYYGSSFYVVRGATNNYTASDYIYRTGDTDLNLGTGDFCVEFWYYPQNMTSNSVMFDNRHESNSWPNSTNGFALIHNAGGTVWIYSGGNPIITHNNKLTANQWNHVAYTRDSGTERLFVNGDFFTTTVSSSRNYNEGRFHLGSAANNGEGSSGYYQGLRIYKGVPKYTSNFNVPVLSVGGVNSYSLKFADNSSNAALGTDSSGSNNDWTVNNLIGPSGSTPTTPGSGYNDNTLGYYLTGNPPLFLTKEPNGTNRGDQITHGSNTGTTWAVNDVLQWAIDWNGGKIWFGRNNTWYSGDPSTGTNPAVSSVTNQNLYLALAYNSPNFELQVPSSASYTLPTGFSYWGGVTLGTWKVSGTNQGGTPDIFSTPIPTSGKIYIEAIIKGGTGIYANVGLMNVGETSLLLILLSTRRRTT